MTYLGSRIAPLVCLIALTIPTQGIAQTTRGNFHILTFPTDSSMVDSAGWIRGKKPGVRMKAIQCEPEPWYSVGQFGSTVSSAAREILGVRFGEPWPDSVSLGFDCKPFQGGSSSEGDEDYWVYRCEGRWLGNAGTRTDFIYLLNGASVPTLERTRFSLPGFPDSDSTYWDRLRAAFVDSLVRRTGKPRLMSGDTLVLRTGTRILLSGGSEIDCYSAGLASDLTNPTWEGDTWEAEEDTVSDGRADVIRALEKRHLALAAVVASPRARVEEITTVADALGRAETSHEQEYRNLITYAAHLWATQFARLLPSRDSTLVHVFNQALLKERVAIVETNDGDWCYTGGLGDSLALHPDADAWTRHAFLQRMQDGWTEACGLCGWISKWRSDYFKPTIERGEAFLRAHPGSPIARDVSLIVGKAHETAWSLSKARGGGEEDYIDWPRYALEGPAHRVQAVERYEAQLRERPSDPRNARIRRRLARLKIDVDTDYHRYWCLWD